VLVRFGREKFQAGAIKAGRAKEKGKLLDKTNVRAA
jgi:hypothetical protein